METPREKVIANAIAEIGVAEEGGNNRGKRVGEYLASTGLGQGHPWCAAFTKFVYDGSGIATPGATAWSPSWFPKSKTYWRKGDNPSRIQSGDLFSIHYSNLGRIGHVGIIESVDDGWIVTIEGNTNSSNSREGDVVKRSRRSLKMVYSASNWIDK